MMRHVRYGAFVSTLVLSILVITHLSSTNSFHLQLTFLKKTYRDGIKKQPNKVGMTPQYFYEFPFISLLQPGLMLVTWDDIVMCTSYGVSFSKALLYNLNCKLAK